MFRSMRGLLALALTCCVILATGCVQKNHSNVFKTEPMIRDGKPITEETWQAIDKAYKEKTDNRLDASSTHLWMLPMNFNIVASRVTAGPDGEPSRAEATHVTWNDLGTPLLLTTLPLRFKFRQYFHERGTDNPVGFNSVTYSPLVFEDRSVGKVDPNFKVKVKGIPLFFAQARLNTKDLDQKSANKFGLNTSLWTLGPAWATFRKETAANDADTTMTERGYIAAPLLLGGALGLGVWSDYDMRGENLHVAGHGPLFGLLGYFTTHQKPTSRTELQTVEEVEVPITINSDGHSLRHVIGGILWHDYTRVDAESGKRLYDRHGPLWSMFGWGHRKDRFNVRFLFVPIG